MKKYAELNRPVHFNGDEMVSDSEIGELIEDELEQTIQ